MATVTAREPLLTLSEYLGLPHHASLEELVRGRIVTMNPPKPSHGRICMEIGALLHVQTKTHNLGVVVCNDSGVITERDPDTLRGADVAFYRRERLPGGKLPKDTYLEIPPDLIVEVLSEHDRWPRVLTKVGEYLTVGVSVVVVLDPDGKTAHVYEGDRPVRVLQATDTLEFPELLGTFGVRVGDLFE